MLSKMLSGSCGLGSQSGRGIRCFILFHHLLVTESLKGHRRIRTTYPGSGRSLSLRHIPQSGRTISAFASPPHFTCLGYVPIMLVSPLRNYGTSRMNVRQPIYWAYRHYSAYRPQALAEVSFMRARMDAGDRTMTFSPSILIFCSRSSSSDFR